ncbi:MAG: hypothetical protein FJ312_10065 [SAR202 cluster bacterium]|nr:hypothetical protein [SAR202 cluster bacterium]
MTKLSGRILDKATGEPMAARVQVLTSQGVFANPKDAILKVGTGEPFLYAGGAFEVEVMRGRTLVEVELLAK